MKMVKSWACSLEDDMFEQAIIFGFNALNNEVEYKASLTRLT